MASTVGGKRRRETHALVKAIREKASRGVKESEELMGIAEAVAEDPSRAVGWTVTNIGEIAKAIAAEDGDASVEALMRRTYGSSGTVHVESALPSSALMAFDDPADRKGTAMSAAIEGFPCNPYALSPLNIQPTMAAASAAMGFPTSVAGLQAVDAAKAEAERLLGGGIHAADSLFVSGMGLLPPTSDIGKGETAGTVLDRRMGCVARGERCATCNSTQDISCTGHSGHIPLMMPISVHPTNLLLLFMRTVCTHCQEIPFLMYSNHSAAYLRAVAKLAANLEDKDASSIAHEVDELECDRLDMERNQEAWERTVANRVGPSDTEETAAMRHCASASLSYLSSIDRLIRTSIETSTSVRSELDRRRNASASTRGTLSAATGEGVEVNSEAAIRALHRAASDASVATPAAKDAEARTLRCQHCSNKLIRFDIDSKGMLVIDPTGTTPDEINAAVAALQERFRAVAWEAVARCAAEARIDQPEIAAAFPTIKARVDRARAWLGKRTPISTPSESSRSATHSPADSTFGPRASPSIAFRSLAMRRVSASSSAAASPSGSEGESEARVGVRASQPPSGSKARSAKAAAKAILRSQDVAVLEQALDTLEVGAVSPRFSTVNVTDASRTSSIMARDAMNQLLATHTAYIVCALVRTDVLRTVGVLAGDETVWATSATARTCAIPERAAKAVRSILTTARIEAKQLAMGRSELASGGVAPMTADEMERAAREDRRAPRSGLEERVAMATDRRVVADAVKTIRDAGRAGGLYGAETLAACYLRRRAPISALRLFRHPAVHMWPIPTRGGGRKSRTKGIPGAGKAQTSFVTQLFNGVVIDDRIVRTMAFALMELDRRQRAGSPVSDRTRVALHERLAAAWLSTYEKITTVITPPGTTPDTRTGSQARALYRHFTAREWQSSAGEAKKGRKGKRMRKGAASLMAAYSSASLAMRRGGVEHAVGKGFQGAQQSTNTKQGQLKSRVGRNRMDSSGTYPIGAAPCLRLGLTTIPEKFVYSQQGTTRVNRANQKYVTAMLRKAFLFMSGTQGRRFNRQSGLAAFPSMCGTALSLLVPVEAVLARKARSSAKKGADKRMLAKAAEMKKAMDAKGPRSKTASMLKLSPLAFLRAFGNSNVPVGSIVTHTGEAVSTAVVSREPVLHREGAPGNILVAVNSRHRDQHKEHFARFSTTQCGPMNADYDGDTVGAAFLTTMPAWVEAIVSINPSKRTHIQGATTAAYYPSYNALLGLHMLTGGRSDIDAGELRVLCDPARRAWLTGALHECGMPTPYSLRCRDGGSVAWMADLMLNDVHALLVIEAVRKAVVAGEEATSALMWPPKHKDVESAVEDQIKACEDQANAGNAAAMRQRATAIYARRMLSEQDGLLRRRARRCEVGFVAVQHEQARLRAVQLREEMQECINAVAADVMGDPTGANLSRHREEMRRLSKDLRAADGSVRAMEACMPCDFSATDAAREADVSANDLLTLYADGAVPPCNGEEVVRAWVEADEHMRAFAALTAAPVDLFNVDAWHCIASDPEVARQQWDGLNGDIQREVSQARTNEDIKAALRRWIVSVVNSLRVVCIQIDMTQEDTRELVVPSDPAPTGFEGIGGFSHFGMAGPAGGAVFDSRYLASDFFESWDKGEEPTVTSTVADGPGLPPTRIAPGATDEERDRRMAADVVVQRARMAPRGEEHHTWAARIRSMVVAPSKLPADVLAAESAKDPVAVDASKAPELQRICGIPPEAKRTNPAIVEWRDAFRKFVQGVISDATLSFSSMSVSSTAREVQRWMDAREREEYGDARPNTGPFGPKLLEDIICWMKPVYYALGKLRAAQESKAVAHWNKAVLRCASIRRLLCLNRWWGEGAEDVGDRRAGSTWPNRGEFAAWAATRLFRGKKVSKSQVKALRLVDGEWRRIGRRETPRTLVRGRWPGASAVSCVFPCTSHEVVTKRGRSAQLWTLGAASKISPKAAEALADVHSAFQRMARIAMGHSGEDKTGWTVIRDATGEELDAHAQVLSVLFPRDLAWMLARMAIELAGPYRLNAETSIQRMVKALDADSLNLERSKWKQAEFMERPDIGTAVECIKRVGVPPVHASVAEELAKCVPRGPMGQNGTVEDWTAVFNMALIDWEISDDGKENATFEAAVALARCIEKDAKTDAAAKQLCRETMPREEFVRAATCVRMAGVCKAARVQECFREALVVHRGRVLLGTVDGAALGSTSSLYSEVCRLVPPARANAFCGDIMAVGQLYVDRRKPSFGMKDYDLPPCMRAPAGGRAESDEEVPEEVRKWVMQHFAAMNAVWIERFNMLMDLAGTAVERLESPEANVSIEGYPAHRRDRFASAAARSRAMRGSHRECDDALEALRDATEAAGSGAFMGPEDRRRIFEDGALQPIERAVAIRQWAENAATQLQTVMRAEGGKNVLQLLVHPDDLPGLYSSMAIKIASVQGGGCGMSGTPVNSHTMTVSRGPQGCGEARVSGERCSPAAPHRSFLLGDCGNATTPMFQPADWHEGAAERRDARTSLVRKTVGVAKKGADGKYRRTALSGVVTDPTMAVASDVFYDFAYGGTGDDPCLQRDQPLPDFTGKTAAAETRDQFAARWLESNAVPLGVDPASVRSWLDRMDEEHADLFRARAYADEARAQALARLEPAIEAGRAVSEGVSRALDEASRGGKVRPGSRALAQKLGDVFDAAFRLDVRHDRDMAGAFSITARVGSDRSRKRRWKDADGDTPPPEDTPIDYKGRTAGELLKEIVARRDRSAARLDRGRAGRGVDGTVPTSLLLVEHTLGEKAGVVLGGEEEEKDDAVEDEDAEMEQMFGEGGPDEPRAGAPRRDARLMSIRHAECLVVLGSMLRLHMGTARRAPPKPKFDAAVAMAKGVYNLCAREKGRGSDFPSWESLLRQRGRGTPPAALGEHGELLFKLLRRAPRSRPAKTCARDARLDAMCAAAIAVAATRDPEIHGVAVKAFKALTGGRSPVICTGARAATLANVHAASVHRSVVRMKKDTEAYLRVTCLPRIPRSFGELVAASKSGDETAASRLAACMLAMQLDSALSARAAARINQHFRDGELGPTPVKMKLTVDIATELKEASRQQHAPSAPPTPRHVVDLCMGGLCAQAIATGGRGAAIPVVNAAFVHCSGHRLSTSVRHPLEEVALEKTRPGLMQARDVSRQCRRMWLRALVNAWKVSGAVCISAASEFSCLNLWKMGLEPKDATAVAHRVRSRIMRSKVPPGSRVGGDAAARQTEGEVQADMNSVRPKLGTGKTRGTSTVTQIDVRTYVALSRDVAPRATLDTSLCMGDAFASTDDTRDVVRRAVAVARTWRTLSKRVKMETIIDSVECNVANALDTLESADGVRRARALRDSLVARGLAPESVRELNWMHHPALCARSGEDRAWVARAYEDAAVAYFTESALPPKSHADAAEYARRAGWAPLSEQVRESRMAIAELREARGAYLSGAHYALSDVSVRVKVSGNALEVHRLTAGDAMAKVVQALSRKRPVFFVDDWDEARPGGDFTIVAWFVVTENDEEPPPLPTNASRDESTGAGDDADQTRTPNPLVLAEGGLMDHPHHYAACCAADLDALARFVEGRKKARKAHIEQLVGTQSGMTRFETIGAHASLQLGDAVAGTKEQVQRVVTEMAIRKATEAGFGLDEEPEEDEEEEAMGATGGGGADADVDSLDYHPLNKVGGSARVKDVATEDAGSVPLLYTAERAKAIAILLRKQARQTEAQVRVREHVCPDAFKEEIGALSTTVVRGYIDMTAARDPEVRVARVLRGADPVLSHAHAEAEAQHVLRVEFNAEGVKLAELLSKSGTSIVPACCLTTSAHDNAADVGNIAARNVYTNTCKKMATSARFPPCHVDVVAAYCFHLGTPRPSNAMHAADLGGAESMFQSNTYISAARLAMRGTALIPRGLQSSLLLSRNPCDGGASYDAM